MAEMGAKQPVMNQVIYVCPHHERQQAPKAACVTDDCWVSTP